MRYGVRIYNSRATAQILLDKALHGNVIWSNATVKGLLQDIITLHDEVEHTRRVIEDQRAEVSRLRREASLTRKGW